MTKLSLLVFELYALFSHLQILGRTVGQMDEKKNRVIERSSAPKNDRIMFVGFKELYKLRHQ